MIIRYAREHDVDIIAALWAEMVKELKPGYTPNIAWWTAMARALLATDAYHLLTAVDDTTGNMIGFIDGFIYPEPATGQVHAVGQHFYVKPGYRKTSAPARLYREALRCAKDKGSQAIEFFCFPEEQSFWEKKSYKPVRMMMRRRLCTTL
mgnify:CR=1 FL=1